MKHHFIYFNQLNRLYEIYERNKKRAWTHGSSLRFWTQRTKFVQTMNQTIQNTRLPPCLQHIAEYPTAAECQCSWNIDKSCSRRFRKEYLPKTHFSSFFQPFSGITSPRNYDLKFCLCLITSVSSIPPQVEPLCLKLVTKSKVCRSKLSKCSKTQRLQESRDNNKSKRKWRWTPWHATLMDLSIPTFVKRMWRIWYSPIPMHQDYQAVIF